LICLLVLSFALGVVLFEIAHRFERAQLTLAAFVRSGILILITLLVIRKYNVVYIYIGCDCYLDPRMSETFLCSPSLIGVFHQQFFNKVFCYFILEEREKRVNKQERCEHIKRQTTNKNNKPASDTPVHSGSGNSNETELKYINNNNELSDICK
jgi:predicted membrane protein